MIILYLLTVEVTVLLLHNFMFQVRSKQLYKHALLKKKNATRPTIQ